jgi:hypothetical protein
VALLRLSAKPFEPFVAYRVRFAALIVTAADTIVRPHPLS